MASNSYVLPFKATRPESPSAFGISSGYDSYSLLGTSAAIERVRSQIRRVAPHFRSALLTGDLGTRGEDVARALHRYSPYRATPLTVLPAVEAELRFTSTGKRAIEISQSMLYLPDVEHLSRTAQEGLLQLMRLRGARAACIVAFTSHNLRSLVSAGSFSPELGSRLGSLRIALPSLSERREDIPTLLGALLSGMAYDLGLALPLLATDFLEAAAEASWPQNFDQMEAIAAALLCNSAPAELRAHHFDAACETERQTAPGGPGPVRMIRLEQVIQEHIRAILLACNGNKLRTAEVLGISRSTLYRTLETADPVPTSPLAG